MTIALDDKGEITHVINDTGEAAVPKPRTTPRVSEFPAQIKEAAAEGVKQ
jgi:hypothetical protein